MPLSLLLIVVGIVLVCAAYYLTLPPPLRGLCMFGGVACLAVGVVLLVVGLLGSAGGLKLAAIALGLR